MLSFSSVLHPESLVLGVARTVLEAHGAKLTPEAQRAAIGRKPLDAWQATMDALGMHGVTAQQLFDESEPLLRSQCACNACKPINADRHYRQTLSGLGQGRLDRCRASIYAQVGACTAYARGGAPAVAPAQPWHPHGRGHEHLARLLRAQNGRQGCAGAHCNLPGPRPSFILMHACHRCCLLPVAVLPWIAIGNCETKRCHVRNPMLLTCTRQQDAAMRWRMASLRRTASGRLPRAWACLPRHAWSLKMLPAAWQLPPQPAMRVIAVPSIRDKDAYPTPHPACTAGDMLLCQ